MRADPSMLAVLMATLTAMTVFDIKLFVGISVGALLQIIFSKRHNIKQLAVIIITTIFMSLFVLTPSLNLLKVSAESDIRIIVLSLSALLSVELILLIIKVAPDAISQKLKAVLDVK